MDISPRKTEFELKFDKWAKQLSHIVFRGGAERGYRSWILTYLGYLRDLKAENQTEHDNILKKNQEYRKMYNMFPGWQDVGGSKQQQFESQDRCAIMMMMMIITTIREAVWPLRGRSERSSNVVASPRSERSSDVVRSADDQEKSIIENQSD
jgi:hypothetical protein